MRVVNVRGLPPYHPSVVYVGRESRGWKGCLFANPFSHLEKSAAPHKVDTVRTAVTAYRYWLWAVFEDQVSVVVPFSVGGKTKEVQVLPTVRDLDDFYRGLKESSQLGCWCLDREEKDIDTKNYRCHAEVLVKGYRVWQHLVRTKRWKV
jgi:hypothetical protein